ncbi:MAG: glycosyltransferase family 2 protein [Bacteroidota bacterium]
MHFPEITVIIPFFNAENTLNRAVQSIVSQTFKNFECILVDNNSIDESRSIAVKWQAKDSRIKLMEESRQGVVFAFGKAAENASGKYIARMDADDYAHLRRLELQYAHLEKNPEVEVISGLVNHKSKFRRRDGLKHYVDWTNNVISYKDICVNRFIDSPIINPTAMWRKETGKKFGLYRHGNFPEDYEMWLRWLYQGVRIEKIPHIVLDWHDSDSRLTRTHPSYSDEAFYRIKTQYLVLWLKQNNQFHPHVTVWGASKISRKRAEMLENDSITIDNFIDIKKTRQIDSSVLFYKDIPPPGKIFILVYVRQWDAKRKIKQYLESLGYSEGKNYLLVS